MTHARAGRRRRAGAGAARDLRRRDRLGAVLPHRIRGGPVADAVGGGPGPRSGPAATERSTRCAWRRATGSGRPTSPPMTARSRRGWSSPCASTSPISAATRLREPQRRLRCVVLEDPRSVALGNEPVRIGGRDCGRVTSGGYGYTVQRSIAYAYLPARWRWAPRSRSTSSAGGSAARWRASHCSTREGMRLGRDQVKIARPDMGRLRGHRDVGISVVDAGAQVAHRGADLHRLVGDQAGARGAVLR